jgi:hypothetical protein
MLRHGSWRWLALGVVTTVLAGGLVSTPAVADNDLAKVLAAVAVGALVYEALDDDCGPRYCPSPAYRPPCPPPNRNPRYNPPSDYYNWNTPRQNYDYGYRDGFGDGRDYGRREVRRVSYAPSYYGPPGQCRRAPRPHGCGW